MSSTSNEGTNAYQSTLDLDNARKSLETEAQAITDELTQPTIGNDGNRTKPMGIDTPLVDEEGYPRSDIDIYRARELRKRLNEIRHDHKLIMKTLESKLTNGCGKVNEKVESSPSSLPQAGKVDEYELKARLAPKPKPKFDKVTGKWVVCNWDGTVAGVENGHLRKFDKLDESLPDSNVRNVELVDVDNSSGIVQNDNIIENAFTVVKRKQPFAKINEIHDKSPASDGGLKLHDTVIQIGSVDETNHRDLQAVADVVYKAFQTKESIAFVVLRPTNQGMKLLSFQVRPGVWEGNGVLGCRIVKA